MANKKHIFLLCGERSGDLHGSRLVQALKAQESGISFSGVPGPKMRQEGVQPLLQMEEFELMGFADVLASLPRLIRAFINIRNQILTSQPDALVLIDYPGFNLRLAKALRAKGYRGKIIQYISPSVWAWGKGRIDTMERTLDLLLTIYPFESAHFAHKTLKNNYVGNPLAEHVAQHSYAHGWQEQLNIPATDRLIAIFPGSREGEIKRNLPLILQAAAHYQQAHADAVFALSAAHAATAQLLQSMRAAQQLPHVLLEAIRLVPPQYTYELMRDCRSAIAKSGSVTLELALHRRPSVVIYQLSAFDRLYAQYILKLRLPHYCIVNILCQQEVFPELIAEKLDAPKLLERLEAIDKQGPQRTKIIQECAQLIDHLGHSHASRTSAALILQTLCS